MYKYDKQAFDARYEGSLSDWTYMNKSLPNVSFAKLPASRLLCYIVTKTS